MSTNAVEHRQTSRKFTVAELVARERTATRPVRPAYDEDEPRAYVPVAELLRREGVTVEGDGEPTAELPAVRLPAPLAPAAPIASVTGTGPVHVTDLLRREGELPEERKRRLTGRAATVGSAAVLCGLTIAGLVALKPNIALSPVGDNQDDPHRQFSAASPDSRPEGAPELQRGGGSAPTTVASLLRNDTADAASPAGSLSGSSPLGGGQGGASGEGTPRTGGTSDDSGTTTSPDGDSAEPTSTQQPQEPEPTSPEPEPEPQPEPEEGVLDPVLDPVLDTLGSAVGGVSKVGGSVQGVVPSSVTAVQDSINGLLGL